MLTLKDQVIAFGSEDKMSGDRRDDNAVTSTHNVTSPPDRCSGGPNHFYGLDLSGTPPADYGEL